MPRPPQILYARWQAGAETVENKHGFLPGLLLADKTFDQRDVAAASHHVVGSVERDELQGERGAPPGCEVVYEVCDFGPRLVHYRPVFGRPLVAYR
jgi:hypothetical protein